MLNRLTSSLLLFITLLGCNKPDKKNSAGNPDDQRFAPKEYVELKHPEWSKNATIYEVNIRQYTREGTFKAFEDHLPRLKEMGVDIIWLMPINPIGVEKRKGVMGSYYSVKDYYGVNPEFGTLADLKSLVARIHSMGMYVIVDWVANHSAWDNELVKSHPDWYSKSPEGNFQPTPWYDWEDIIDFDYDKPELRKYMTDAMKYWVKEADIDGYRCDVAGFIPVDFWDNVRTELDAIKPVFMLAEWESRDLHKNAFDMTYSWSLWEKMHAAAKDNKGISGIIEYMAHDVSTFPRNAYRMTFTENHDKNSWEGNQFSNFGESLEASMVLACTVNGMPLVYSGQEAGLDRSLKFFDKDQINWKDHQFAKIYKKLFDLKHQNQALWNGGYGGVMIRIFNDTPEQVISFSREKNGDRIITIVNYSAKPVKAKLDSKYEAGNYSELFTAKEYKLSGADELSMKPWEYIVLVRKKTTIKTMTTKYTTIDEYHAAFPEMADKLQLLRRIIRNAAPGAAETISYNMPAFKLHSVLVYYAAYKNHIGFYPTTNPIKVFSEDLTAYKTSKGAIQFPIASPIPEDLVQKIVTFRMAEDAERHRQKKKTR